MARKATVSAIDHVAVVVRDIRKARRFYRELGLKVSPVYTVGERYPGEQRGHVYYGCSLRFQSGRPSIWLMQPKGRCGPLAKFVRTRGEGLHHIGLLVRDVRKLCDKLSKKRIRLIRAPHDFTTDKEIRALIHPDESFHSLLELVQKTE